MQAFPVSPLTLPITVVVIPCGSDATPGTVTGVPVPTGGQVASFVNTLSVTTQFARSAVPVFISLTSTWFVPSAACTTHVFVTVRPGVSHWNFAMSFAVATKLGFLSAVQKQLSVAVSGSLRASRSLQVRAPAGVWGDVPPIATSPSAMGPLLMAEFESLTVHPNSWVVPVFLTAYWTLIASAGIPLPAFQPMHEPVPSSLLVTKPVSTNGPAPHFTCLSTCALQLSHVSFAVAVSVF